jgi:hypothetical protein
MLAGKVGTNKKCVPNFDAERFRKRLLERPKRRWYVNIMVDLRQTAKACPAYLLLT